MRPIAKARRKGERRSDTPPSPADADHAEAVAAAARVLQSEFRIAQEDRAKRMADVVLVAYLGTLGFRSINHPELRAALTAEEPWSLMKLIDKDAAEEAALNAALPVVAEMAAAIDPTGQKPLGSYSKDQILQLFEAVVAVWEEHRQPGKGLPKPSKFPDDEIPF